MKIYQKTFAKLEEVMSKSEQIENLEQRIIIMEQAIFQLKDADENKWVSLKEASTKLSQSPAAIRQRIKNPESMMPQNVVWKQKSRGSEILINLKKYRKCR
jgi:hypothetical protein